MTFVKSVVNRSNQGHFGIEKSRLKKQYRRMSVVFKEEEGFMNIERMRCCCGRQVMI